MQLHATSCKCVQLCAILLLLAITYCNVACKLAVTDFFNSCFSLEVACKQREETVCTNTPRHKTSETCKKSEEKVCEEVYERKPYPYSKPHCRNEGKKVCHVEQKTQPKQIKKYR